MSSSGKDEPAVVCECCLSFYSNESYFRRHLKYQSKWKCKSYYRKIQIASLPVKRDFCEGVDDEVDKLDEVVGKQLRFSSSVKEMVMEDAAAQQQIADYQEEQDYEEEENMEAMEAEEFEQVEDDEDHEVEDDFGVLFDDDVDEELWENVDDGEFDAQYETEMRLQFEEYCKDKQRNTCPLTPEVQAGVELMSMLCSRRVPLKLYELIFTWHLQHLRATKAVPRKGLMELLRDRYNLQKKRPKIHKSIVLPCSGSRVNLVVHDAKEQVQSLLIDPRINDEDYLFFNDDPFEAPPEEFSVLGDINTGRAYRETYKKLIKDPTKEVLLPVILYMDGAITGQFDNLPMEAMKFTLGIFNRTARDRHYFWRKLGYMTTYLPEKTAGQVMLQEATNIDAKQYLSDSDSDEEASLQSIATDASNKPIPGSTVGKHDDEDELTNNNVFDHALRLNPQQDYHAMLDVIFESYHELERIGGIEWKLQYKGKTHDVLFKPFVMFVKGDTEEHDKLCGKYTARGHNIKQLCRYCCCPNAETDDPYADFEAKTKPMVVNLVKTNNLVGLQQLSQSFVQNATYKLKFGRHNNQGIHGGSPVEILHWIQLGLFQQIVQLFFQQAGKKSILTDKICAFAKVVGPMFTRQSDRDYPNTDFSKGIKTGKLQAHEMTGLMLVLVATLRSTQGRSICIDHSRETEQQKFFGCKKGISDWILLLESMLQMEAWLKLPELGVFHVRRYQTKVREILDLYKRIGRREEGMGFKTFKFHAAIHVSEDILNFGVPMNVHTGSNEMHHKPDKNAALKTQRRPKTFDYQFAKQCHNQDVIEFAIQEMLYDRVPWEYYLNEADLPAAPSNQPEIITKGTQVSFFRIQDSDEYTYTVESRMKKKHRFKLGNELTNFLEAFMREKLEEDIKVLSIRTQHNRHGVIFRASPFHLGKPWRDWVMIRWGGEDDDDPSYDLPAQIWCFIDLSHLKDGAAIEAGVYAVIESADPNEAREEQNISKLFEPYIKERQGKNRKYHVVNTSSFAAPACVIPDIGNKKSDYAFLRLLPREEWCNKFNDFLETEQTLVGKFP